MVCAICLQKFKKVSDFDKKKKLTTCCEHHFHAECIERWWKRKVTPKCPICRRKHKNIALRDSSKKRVLVAKKKMNMVIDQ